MPNQSRTGDSNLVGRVAESAQLEKALAEAVERGGALLITGPAGIGKTSLLDAVAGAARSRGHGVLTVTGLESEANLPFAGLHQLLQPVLSLARVLPTPQRQALLTALGMRAGTPPEVFLVGLATLNLLDELGDERPLLVVADDFQWLDGPTSSVLSFIARRLQSTHILLAIAMRENFDSPLRSYQLPEIYVGPLGDAASTELLASVAPDFDIQTRRLILNEALGNPLALLELPRAFRLQGIDGREGALRSIPLTDRLERAFSVQAAQLPHHTQSALLLVAVDKDPTVSDILGATRVLVGEEVTLDVLQTGIEAGLISVAGSLVRYRHPLIRSAVEQAATAGDRRSAHLALAHVIVDPDRRAWHRAKAVLGEDESAAADLEAAAGRAQDRGATATALGALELAGSLTPQGPAKARRLLAAAELAFQLGDPPAVGRLLDAAARLQLTPNDRARMTWLREIFHDGAPGNADTITELVKVARDAAAGGDRDLALNLLQGAGLRCWWADPGPAARELVVQAVEQLDAGESDARVLEILSLASPVDAGGRVAKRVAEVALADDNGATRKQVLGFAAHAVGDYGQALALLKHAAPGLRAEGKLGLVAQLLTVRAWDEIHVAQFADANLDAEEGFSLAGETEQPIRAAGSTIARALLAGLRGEEGLAERLAAEAEAAALPLGLSDLLAVLELARGLTAMTAGRHSDGFDHFARMFDPHDVSFNELESYAAAGYVMECAVHSERQEEGRDVMVKLESLGSRTPAALLHVGLRYARAVLAEDSEAETLYEVALETDPKWPFDYARLQMSYGRWLRRQRRIVESRPHLRKARDSFEALGVHPWADKARIELRASGERVSGPTKAPQQALSPQELQVAQMAASGLSNREIGDRLFLSHRTVGTHLYRVYPKLGIVSRSELARVLAALEPSLIE